MTDLFGRFATTRQIEPIIGIKERTLYRLRQANILKKGKHYRLKNPLNPKSHILYDVAAVIEELTRADLEKTLIEEIERLKVYPKKRKGTPYEREDKEEESL